MKLTPPSWTPGAHAGLSSSGNPPSANLVWHQGKVSIQEREQGLRQRPATLWLTGLSGSGKSTLAFELERQLINLGRACTVLDGDNVRHGLNRDLGFSPADRQENIRRIAEVARLMNDAGLLVVTAFISPSRDDRDMARDIIGDERFFEVWVRTDLATCEARDPKGLYVKARRGQIQAFTGISAPYDEPLEPRLALDTGERSIEACTEELMELLAPRLL